MTPPPQLCEQAAALLGGPAVRRRPLSSQPVKAGVTLNAVQTDDPYAKVAELADAPDLGSGGETRGGSSPPFRTNPSLSEHNSIFEEAKLRAQAWQTFISPTISPG
jgi:hypothetical protein